MAALAADPALFSRLLAFHTGELAPWRLGLGATARLVARSLAGAPPARRPRVRRESAALRRAAALVLLALGRWPRTSRAASSSTTGSSAGSPPAPPRRRRYAAFRDTFGSDEFVVVAVSAAARLRAGVAAPAIGDCLERLEAVPGVVRVQGLPPVYRDLFGGEDPAELEREMTSTPFYTGLLLSERPRRGRAMLVEVAPGDGPAARRRLVDGVRDATAPLTDATASASRSSARRCSSPRSTSSPPARRR